MGVDSGYFATHRSIFDHPLFQDRPHWLAMWQWMIAQAAWRPKGRRTPSGAIVDLQRGQLAATVRELMAVYGWGKGTVAHFLRVLQRAEMIELSIVRTGFRTRSYMRRSHAITVITICNYNKFQYLSPQERAAETRRLGQSLGQDESDCPIIPGLFDTGISSTNSITGSSPLSGYPTKDGLVLIPYGSILWRTFAEDFRAHTGAEPFPSQRNGGYWFYQLGESKRPADLKARRRRAQSTLPR